LSTLHVCNASRGEESDQKNYIHRVIDKKSTKINSEEVPTIIHFLYRYREEILCT